MDATQRAIIDAALPMVVFDGWSMDMLHKAAESAGLHRMEAERAFPGGIIQCLNLWTIDANDALAERLAARPDFLTLKIRERIAEAVMDKLIYHQPHREAVRRAMAVYQLPWHAGDGLKQLYHTVDTIWRAAGDTSTDWNFYSKRALLAHVYMTTLTVWLDDTSDNLMITREFLQRRIEEVMQIQKAKFTLKEKFSAFKMPF